MPVREVFEGVYKIALAWSSVYVLKNERRAALIDTGLQKDRPALLAGLRELDLAEQDIEAVYLTHAHCDHAGSAAFFAQCGAKIYVHKNELPFIRLPRQTYVPRGLAFWTRPLTSLLFAVGEWRFPVERCNPDAALADGEIINAPGGILRVISSPGHTPGHAAYFRERDGVLFSGDAILTLVPIKRSDALSLPIRALSSDWAQAKYSAQRLAALKPRAVLAGHGRPLLQETPERLAEWAATLTP